MASCALHGGRTRTAFELAMLPSLRQQSARRAYRSIHSAIVQPVVLHAR